MKYLIYARVSPKGSSWAANETSIATQIQLCRQYVGLQGGEVVEIVKDEFESAKSLDRPGMQRILAELQHGAEWDAVLAYRLDRITRSVPDGAPLFQQLLDQNKGMATVKENIDMATPFGRCHLTILLAFAQLEREQTADRTRDRMTAIAAAGEWGPGMTPFGYVRRGKGDNVLVPDPRKAEVVKQIYKRYLDGHSTTVIGRDLCIGKSSQVCFILRNPIYTGVIRYNGQVYPGKHKAIISLEDFKAVQKKLPGQRHGPRWAAHKRENLLTGLVFCSCGRPMTTTYTQKKTRRYYYYCCTGKRQCKHSRVRAEHLEELVLSTIRYATFDPKQLAEHVDRIRTLAKERQHKARPELASVRKALAKARKEQENVEGLFLGGLVTPENAALLNSRLAKVTTEVRELEAREQLLQSMQQLKLGPYESVTKLAQTMKGFVDAVNADDSPVARRILLQANVAKVVRQKDDPNAFAIEFVAGGCANSPMWLPGRDLAQLALMGLLCSA